MPTDRQRGETDGLNGTPSIIHRGNADYDAGLRQGSYDSALRGSAGHITGTPGERLDRPSSGTSHPFLGPSLVISFAIAVVVCIYAGYRENDFTTGLLWGGGVFFVLGWISEALFD